MIEIGVNMAQALKYRGPACVAGMAIIAVLFLSGCANPAEKRAKFVETGKRFLDKKDYPRATLQFRNAIQVMPKDAEAHYELALAYLGMGATQQAVGELNKAAQLDPKHLPTQLKLAELMATSNNKQTVEEARKRVEGVLVTTPDDAEALTTLALTNLRLGESQNAEQDLIKALRAAPTNLRSSMLLASVKLSQKDMAGAEQVMKDAVAKDPKSKDAAMALGQLYRILRRNPEAEAQFQRAIQIDPKDGAPLIQLGAIQMASGRKDLAEQTYRKAAALPGSQYRTTHAQFLLSQNRTDEAIVELKDLMAKDAKDRETRNLLVGVYVAKNRLPEATKILSDVLAKNPKDVDALFARARIRVMAGQYADAQKDLLTVLNYRADMAQAHHLLAKVYQAQGSMGAYRQELEEAIRRNPQYLNARLEMASVLMNSNAAQAALDLMDQTPAAQKSNVFVMVQRNGALMGLGRWDDAAKGIEAGLKISRSPDLLIQEAILKMQRKDPAGARKSVEEALTLAPENVRALAVLVGTYRAQGQAEAGLRRLQEYAARYPKSAPVQQYLGVVSVAGGKRAEARAAFEAAKAANPNSAEADLSLAQLDLMDKKPDDARKRLSAVLAKNDASTPAHLMLAEIELQAGNSAAAIAQYRKVLETDSRNLVALNGLGYLLADEANQPDEALKYAQQAKELAPNNAAVDDTLGWVYYCKGLYPVAAGHLEAAVAKEPNARRKYHLAMAYFKSGDGPRGTVQLNQALKMDSTLPEAVTAQRMAAETGSGAAKH
jgi:tetratricopeptide (TPR) repeat protein